jgi:hypothetical protein
MLVKIGHHNKHESRKEEKEIAVVSYISNNLEKKEGYAELYKGIGARGAVLDELDFQHLSKLAKMLSHPLLTHLWRRQVGNK